MAPLLIADLLSTGLKAGEGIADLIRAGRLNRAANAAIPPTTDPQEQEMTALLNTIRKGRYTGTAYGEATRQLDRNQNLVNNQIVQTGGGGGATLAALGAAGDQYGDNYGKIFAGDEANKLGYTQMYNEAVNRMVQRRAGLAMMKYAQLKAEATQAKQSGEENLNLLATTLPDLIPTSTGADMSKKKQYLQERAQEAINPIQYLPTPKTPIQTFGKGGTIHIKESHKGRFTLWARKHGFDSVQAAASTVLQNKEKYDSSVVKMAAFAKASTKFVHGDGGTVKPTKKPKSLQPWQKAYAEHPELYSDKTTLNSGGNKGLGTDLTPYINAADDFDEDMRLTRDKMPNPTPHKRGGDVDEPETNDNPQEESNEPILMFDRDSGEMIGTMDYDENIMDKEATRTMKRMARKGQHLQLGKFVAKELKSQPY